MISRKRTGAPARVRPLKMSTEEADTRKLGWAVAGGKRQKPRKGGGSDV